MLAIWAKGIKLVIGQRVDREESLPHRLLALTYHSLIKKIALPNIPEGGYDLVLFDREIRDKIVAMNESNINLIYLISWLQYPYATIPITRVARTKGKSAWTFNKKTKLFADTIVGFSYWPIRAVTGMAIFGGLAFITLSAKALFDTASGHMHSAVFWLAYIILGCTTVLTIIASVIAEYLWRTLEAARRRPPFIIDKIL
jgi:dolichol-phosphate mannosyltransferase